MNIRHWAAGLLVVGALANAASAQAPGAPAGTPAPEDRSVSCYANGSYEALERRALGTALRGANRVSAHDLTVSTVAGVMRFSDRKPYRNGLNGFHWLYCGYVPKLHAHLIGVFDEDLFSGKLLLDQTGKVLDAGRAVYPSPGGKLFLAANQKNGAALEDWVLSDLAGRKLWTGPSGLTGKDAVLVEYGSPRWTSDGEIRVTARCNGEGGAKGAASLVRQGGTWRWRSKLQCGA